MEDFESKQPLRGTREDKSSRSSLDSTDANDDLPDGSIRQYSSPSMSFKSRSHRALRILAQILIFFLSLYGTVDLVFRLHRTISSSRAHQHHFVPYPSIPKDFCNCGNSSSEAVAMGCEYEPLAAAWLPPACRDSELSAEFDHAGPGPNGSWG